MHWSWSNTCWIGLKWLFDTLDFKILFNACNFLLINFSQHFLNEYYYGHRCILNFRWSQRCRMVGVSSNWFPLACNTQAMVHSRTTSSFVSSPRNAAPQLDGNWNSMIAPRFCSRRDHECKKTKWNVARESYIYPSLSILIEY